MDSVKNYIQENKDRFIAELIELLKCLLLALMLPTRKMC